MLVYIGIDDTDTAESAAGTGRLAREFAASLAEGVRVIGVVRHQLPRMEDIEYTSNNSSACLLLESLNGLEPEDLADLACDYITRRFTPGSDPGVLAARADHVGQELLAFSREATARRFSQKEALSAAAGLDLRGLGGTNDGIIGAAAAVGLTSYGWCGRFIEYGRLRRLRDPLTVRDLNKAGIMLVSVDRDPAVPLPEDRIASGGWIRPSLWAGRPVLQIVSAGPGLWRPAHGKRKKGQTQP